jgi:hypothetical protein
MGILVAFPPTADADNSIQFPQYSPLSWPLAVYALLARATLPLLQNLSDALAPPVPQYFSLLTPQLQIVSAFH